MHTSKRIATGLVSLGLVFGAGVGIAQAAQKASGSKTSAAGGRGPGPFGGAALADYLGLTAAQLRTQLESGKTLAQVATAQSKTVAGLEDAIVAEARAHLDADVAAGRITAAQEATSLADLEANVDDMVNGAGPPRGGPHGGRGHGGPFDVAAIADYLGLTPAELRTQLDAGNSLADVAKAQGKTGAGLQDAIVAAATKQLDAQVAAGTITAAQEATRLADLKSHVDEMISQTGPPGGHPKR
jgi:hypothetical protein